MRPEHINEIKRLILEKSNNKSRNQIKQILSQEPSPFDFSAFYKENAYHPYEDNFTLFMTTARCLQEMERYSDTLTVLNHMQPNNPTILLAKGRCLQKMNRHQEALDLYQRIRFPEQTTLLTIGRCLQEMHRYEDALAVFDQMNHSDHLVVAAKAHCVKEMQRDMNETTTNDVMLSSNSASSSIASGQSTSLFFTAPSAQPEEDTFLEEPYVRCRQHQPYSYNGTAVFFVPKERFLALNQPTNTVSPMT